MTVILSLIKRNVKLFFKDKGMFFTALITPTILLVLYATFLGNIYRDSFIAGLPQGVTLSDEMLNGLVGGQLASSILAVSCVTVAFCSNFLMVQDRANGTVKDFLVSPVKSATLSISYYAATLISTLTVCLTAMALCLGYIAVIGWHLSFLDVLLLFFDVVLLVLFGTALSSVIGFFLSTQGQISAVGTIISSGYGFVCGAYMPISSFAEGLRNAVVFLPGTHGTSLLRRHAMRGVFEEMAGMGLPPEALKGMQDAVDYNLYLFGAEISPAVMLAVLLGAGALLLGVYVWLNCLRKKQK